MKKKSRRRNVMGLHPCSGGEGVKSGEKIAKDGVHLAKLFCEQHDTGAGYVEEELKKHGKRSSRPTLS